MKRCCRCGGEKSTAEFYSDRRASDGLRGHCKACHLAESTAYNKAHREITRAAGRKWYASRKNDPAFQEQNATRVREWNAANRERHRARARQWYRENRERAIAALRGLPPLDEASQDYAALLRRDPCSYCGAATEDVDHIVPVARGGHHHWTNFTAACGSCNNRKYALPLLAFLHRATA